MSNASRIVPHDRRSWSSSNSSKLIKRVSVNREKKKKKKAILWTRLGISSRGQEEEAVIGYFGIHRIQDAKFDAAKPREESGRSNIERKERTRSEREGNRKLIKS